MARDADRNRRHRDGAAEIAAVDTSLRITAPPLNGYLTVRPYIEDALRDDGGECRSFGTRREGQGRITEGSELIHLPLRRKQIAEPSNWGTSRSAASLSRTTMRSIKVNWLDGNDPRVNSALHWFSALLCAARHLQCAATSGSIRSRENCFLLYSF